MKKRAHFFPELVLLFLLSEVFALCELVLIPFFYLLIQVQGENLSSQLVYLLKTIHSTATFRNFQILGASALIFGLVGFAGEKAGKKISPKFQNSFILFASGGFFLFLLIILFLQAGSSPLSRIKELGFYLSSLLIYLFWLWSLGKRKAQISWAEVLCSGLGLSLILIFLRSIFVLYQPKSQLTIGLTLFFLMLLFPAFIWLGRKIDQKKYLPVQIGVYSLLLIFGFFILSLPLWSWGKYYLGKKIPKKASPNLVLLVLDTLRKDHLSLYGYARKTSPFLEKLGGSSWVFEQAFSSSPWTIPSHASFFTGLLPSQLNCHYEHFPLAEKFETLAEKLKKQGYFTLGWSNNPLLNYPSGLLQGFDRFVEAHPLELYSGELVFSWLLKLKPDYTQDSGAKYTNQKLARWLAHLSKKKKPFFLFVNYMETHLPYPTHPLAYQFFTNPETARKKYPQPDWDKYNCWREKNPQLKKAVEKWYDGAILYLDRQLEQLYQTLKQYQLLDNTILIILSDHGESFGEHNWWGHGATLYNTELAVPLIIHYPGKTSPQRIQSPLSLSQVPELIFQLLEEKNEAEILTHLKNQEVYAEIFKPVIYLERISRICPDYESEWLNRREKALIQYPYKLILSSRGEVKLFNFLTDPKEKNDLSRIKPELKKELLSRLQPKAGFLKQTRARAGFSAHTHQALKSLQYLK